MMDWIKGGPATHFTTSGDIERRAELKDRLSTIELEGTVSELRWLTMKNCHVTEAYALFQERESGKRWIAVVLNKADGKKGLDYAVIPEWLNPAQCNCGKRILMLATPLQPGESPAAEEWRARCWENISAKESPATFANLPEGAQAVWTVGSDNWPLLPKGRRTKLEKVRSRGKWYWKDLDSDVLYTDDMIPEDEIRVLPH